MIKILLITNLKEVFGLLVDHSPDQDLTQIYKILDFCEEMEYWGLDDIYMGPCLYLQIMRKILLITNLNELTISGIKI